MIINFIWSCRDLSLVSILLRASLTDVICLILSTISLCLVNIPHRVLCKYVRRPIIHILIQRVSTLSSWGKAFKLFRDLLKFAITQHNALQIEAIPCEIAILILVALFIYLVHPRKILVHIGPENLLQKSQWLLLKSIVVSVQSKIWHKASAMYAAIYNLEIILTTLCDFNST